jgi:signal transduction histidine kinase
LKIRVQDDGKGVTEEQAKSPLSLGLIGIRERVQALQGEMWIVGRSGRGTFLEVTIPLPSTGALA